MSDYEFDEIQTLWKQQSIQPLEVDMTELKKKADGFVRKIRIRNVLEWLAASFVAVFFVGLAVTRPEFPVITKVDSLLIAAAALYVGVRLTLDGRVGRLPDPAQNTVVYVQAYRDRLLDQAQLLRAVPYWYLAPFVPGFMAFYFGFLELAPNAWPALVLMFVLNMALFVGIAWLNRRAARTLTAQADELMQPLDG